MRTGVISFGCKVRSPERSPGRSGFRNGFQTLGVLFFCLLAPVSRVAGEPVWVDAVSAARVVFLVPPGEEHCLVSAPARLGSEFLSGTSAWAGSAPVSFRLVWTDGTTSHYLVDCHGMVPQQEIFLYLRGQTSPPEPPETGLTDPTPVRFTAERTAGQDLPATWEQIQVLESRVDPDPVVLSLASMDVDETGPTGWFRGDWQRKNHLIRFKTWLLVPKAGQYLFGLKTDLAYWMLIDGARLVEPSTDRRLTWNWSRSIPLSAGLHRVEVRGVSRDRMRLSTGWRAEGGGKASGVVPITGGEPVRGRFERHDRRLHAQAVVTPGPVYSFEGSPSVFSDVKFESRSLSWDNRPMTAVWEQDGVVIGTGRTVRVVLAGRSTPVRIGLTVTDDKGHAAQDAMEVTIGGPPRKVYRVSGRLFGVPAVAYEEDPVRPEVQVRATSPDKVDFDVFAQVEHVSASGTERAGLVDMIRTWGRLVLPQEPAGVLRSIAWQVKHAGVTLDAGTTVVERTPFQYLPDALDGDCIMHGETNVSWIARHASAGDPLPFPKVQAGQRVLFLDGFLAPLDVGRTQEVVRMDRRLGRVVESDPDSAVAYRRVNLHALEQDNSSDGVSRLLPLVQAGSLLPADVVIIAPAVDSLADGDSVELFERRLSALVGLLTGPGRARVLLVTPPPFDCLTPPGGTGYPCVQMPGSRQLAEMVCRVADAYGMPVVDLYTAFLGADADETWIDGAGGLTPTGLEQATGMVRRALYGRQKTSP